MQKTQNGSYDLVPDRRRHDHGDVHAGGGARHRHARHVPPQSREDDHGHGAEGAQAPRRKPSPARNRGGLRGSATGRVTRSKRPERLVATVLARAARRPGRRGERSPATPAIPIRRGSTIAGPGVSCVPVEPPVRRWPTRHVIGERSTGSRPVTWRPGRWWQRAAERPAATSIAGRFGPRQRHDVGGSAMTGTTGRLARRPSGSSPPCSPGLRRAAATSWATCSARRWANSFRVRAHRPHDSSTGWATGTAECCVARSAGRSPAVRDPSPGNRRTPRHRRRRHGRRAWPA